MSETVEQVKDDYEIIEYTVKDYDFYCISDKVLQNPQKKGNEMTRKRYEKALKKRTESSLAGQILVTNINITGKVKETYGLKQVAKTVPITFFILDATNVTVRI